MQDRWLSVTEVCDYLGVSRDTIYKWIDVMKMPATRVGRCWRFKKDQIDDWMQSGGTDTSSSGSLDLQESDI